MGQLFFNSIVTHSMYRYGSAFFQFNCNPSDYLYKRARLVYIVGMIGIEQDVSSLGDRPRIGELWKFSKPGWCPSSGTGLVIQILRPGPGIPGRQDDFTVYELLVDGEVETAEPECMEEKVGQRNT
jgi:hypothetical protein